MATNARNTRLLLVFLSFLAFPAISLSQPVKQVLLLKSFSKPIMDDRERLFIEYLNKAAMKTGYRVDVRSIDINADADAGLLQLQAAMREVQPDLVVTLATLATKLAWSQRDKLLKDTETLFFFVSDPVGVGIVASIGATTGRNFTGLTNVVARRHKLDTVLQLIRQRGSAMHRVLLLHTTYPSSLSDVTSLQEAGQAHSDLDFVPLQVEFQARKSVDRYLTEVADKLADIRSEFDYVWIALGPVSRQSEYVEGLKALFKQPIIWGNNKASVEAGALVAITSTATIDARSAATVANDLLTGIRAAEMPVGRSTDFQLVINLQTAERLDIVIPSSMLELATGHLVR